MEPTDEETKEVLHRGLRPPIVNLIREGSRVWNGALRGLGNNQCISTSSYLYSAVIKVECVGLVVVYTSWIRIARAACHVITRHHDDVAVG